MNIEERLAKYFGKPEEINGNRCPTYLYRWQIFKKWGYGIYLHKFVGNDWSKDLHDHPRRFISIGLKGQYFEHLDGGLMHIYSAPWIRAFPPEHKHRITLDKGTVCWTLVIVCKIKRKWGFWHKGVWTHWKTFVDSKEADEVKDCL